MAEKKDAPVLARRVLDPFAVLRQFTGDFDRLFDPFGSFRWPALPAFPTPEGVGWAPQIDVFERDHHLITKIDLPGLKKEDVKVEVADGMLVISGDRKIESEEKKDNVYRSERSYGSFYRAVPLPDGLKLEDVKATFRDGVLEVSLPIVQVAAKPRTVPIEEPASVKTAA